MLRWVIAVAVGSAAFVALEFGGLGVGRDLLVAIPLGLAAAIVIAGLLAGADATKQWVGVGALTVVGSILASIWFTFTFVHVFGD